MGDWDGTVELAETVTVTLFSVRIARRRVVRRNDSATLRESPSELGCIAGSLYYRTGQVYVAQIVATLEN